MSDFSSFNRANLFSGLQKAAEGLVKGFDIVGREHEEFVTDRDTLVDELGLALTDAEAEGNEEGAFRLRSLIQQIQSTNTRGQLEALKKSTRVPTAAPGEAPSLEGVFAPFRETPLEVESARIIGQTTALKRNRDLSEDQLSTIFESILKTVTGIADPAERQEAANMAGAEFAGLFSEGQMAALSVAGGHRNTVAYRDAIAKVQEAEGRAVIVGNEADISTATIGVTIQTALEKLTNLINANKLQEAEILAAGLRNQIGLATFNDVVSQSQAQTQILLAEAETAEDRERIRVERGQAELDEFRDQSVRNRLEFIDQAAQTQATTAMIKTQTDQIRQRMEQGGVTFANDLEDRSIQKIQTALDYGSDFGLDDREKEALAQLLPGTPEAGSTAYQEALNEIALDAFNTAKSQRSIVQLQEEAAQLGIEVTQEGLKQSRTEFGHAQWLRNRERNLADIRDSTEFREGIVTAQATGDAGYFDQLLHLWDQGGPEMKAMQQMGITRSQLKEDRARADEVLSDIRGNASLDLERKRALVAEAQQAFLDNKLKTSLDIMQTLAGEFTNVEQLAALPPEFKTRLGAEGMDMLEFFVLNKNSPFAAPESRMRFLLGGPGDATTAGVERWREQFMAEATAAGLNENQAQILMDQALLNFTTTQSEAMLNLSKMQAETDRLLAQTNLFNAQSLAQFVTDNEDAAKLALDSLNTSIKVANAQAARIELAMVENRCISAAARTFEALEVQGSQARLEAGPTSEAVPISRDNPGCSNLRTDLDNVSNWLASESKKQGALAGAMGAPAIGQPFTPTSTTGAQPTPLPPSATDDAFAPPTAFNVEDLTPLQQMQFRAAESSNIDLGAPLPDGTWSFGSNLSDVSNDRLIQVFGLGGRREPQPVLIQSARDNLLGELQRLMLTDLCDTCPNKERANIITDLLGGVDEVRPLLQNSGLNQLPNEFREDVDLSGGR